MDSRQSQCKKFIAFHDLARFAGIWIEEHMPSRSRFTDERRPTPVKLRRREIHLLAVRQFVPVVRVHLRELGIWQKRCPQPIPAIEILRTQRYYCAMCGKRILGIPFLGDFYGFAVADE